MNEQGLIGKVVGQYRLIEKLGAGGMGSVYRAHQTDLDRDVAFKVLPIALANNPKFTERFRREARIVARLEHPHIVPIYDFGAQEGIFPMLLCGCSPEER